MKEIRGKREMGTPIGRLALPGGVGTQFNLLNVQGIEELCREARGWPKKVLAFDLVL
jgi:hypothetical protein